MADQKQSGFGNFVNSKIMPPVMKFVNTKAITALQNGMVYSLPFIIIGSIFLILGNILFQLYQMQLMLLVGVLSLPKQTTLLSK